MDQSIHTTLTQCAALQKQVNDPNTPPPIRLVSNDVRGKTTVVLHLGAAAIVFGLPAGPHEVGPVLG
jgi:hypothetical protein